MLQNFIRFTLIGLSLIGLIACQTTTRNIMVGDKLLSPETIPFLQNKNHFAHDLDIRISDVDSPPSNLQKMSEQEIREWLTNPQFTFLVHSDGDLEEEWFFPDLTTVYFVDGDLIQGKISFKNDTICFRYGAKSGWCPNMYRYKDGIYFTLTGEKVWVYAHTKSFTSDLSGTEVFNRLNQGQGQSIMAAFGSSTEINSTIPSETRSNNDIAIIIGNKDYNSRTSNIPDVKPAKNDSRSVYKYFTDTKNIDPKNILRIDNASQSDLIKAFGSHRNHKGTAFNWVKPGKSNLYVYYAGHGAPTEDGGMLVPTDARFDSIELNGYPIQQLLSNLSKIPTKSTTVILESCFSGVSQAGSLMSNASPVYLKNGESEIPSNINLITAAGPNQIASWQKDKRKSLFTKFLLEGLYGAADGDGYGNKDGKISQFELQAYLDDNLTYQARRTYGRDQNSQVQFTNGFAF